MAASWGGGPENDQKGDRRQVKGFFLSRWQYYTAGLIYFMLRVVIVLTISLVTVSVFCCTWLTCYCADHTYANGSTHTLSREPQRRTWLVFCDDTTTCSSALMESDLLIHPVAISLSPFVWVVSVHTASAMR